MQPLNQPDVEQPEANRPVEAAGDAPTPIAEAPREPQAAPVSEQPSTMSTPTPTPASTASHQEPAAGTGYAQQPQPSPVQTPAMSAASSPMPQAVASGKPKNKQMMLIGIIVAAALLIGGGVWAYMWYQNPDKVVLDGILNTAKAKQAIITGTTSIKSKDVEVAINMDIKGTEDTGSLKADVKLKLAAGQFAGQEFKVTADSVMAKEGDMYFKVSNLQKAVDGFVDSMVDSYADQYRQMGYTLTPQDIAQMRTAAKSQFQTIVSKIDNQWIKMTADDMSSSTKDSTCVTDVYKKVAKDKKMSNELYDVYTKNRFLVVKEKLGVKDGSYGFLLALDEAAAKKFGNEVKNTEFGKELVKCDSDIFKESEDSSKKSEDAVKNGRFELWVDQWSHRTTRMIFNAESPDSATSDVKLSGDFKFDYNTKVDEVKAPEGAKSIKELEADIKSLTGSASMLSSET